MSHIKQDFESILDSDFMARCVRLPVYQQTAGSMAGLWSIAPQLSALLVDDGKKLAAAKMLENVELYGITTNRIAVVSIRGMMLKGFSFYYTESTDTVLTRQAIRHAANNPDVDGILLVIDSPGGMVAGTADLAADIKAVKKPVHVYIEDMGASAAYWVASQGRTISANPGALVGSMGVFTVYYDASEMFKEAGVQVHVVRSGEHKGTGVLGDKITPAQLANEQELIDNMASMFVSAVASGRGVAESKIRKLADGRVWLAEEAKELGLVDKVETLDAALAGVRAAVGGNFSLDVKETGTMADKNDADTTAVAAKEEADLEALQKQAADEAAKAATAGAVNGLKALEAAFPNDQAFARTQWEQGHSVEEARAAHYPLVLEQLAKAQAENTAAGENAEKLAAELEETKKTFAAAGVEPLENTSTASGGDAISDYDAKVKELADAGDGSPEATIAVKHQALHAAYLDAVNAKQ